MSFSTGLSQGLARGFDASPQASAAPVFDPSTLSPTEWLKPNYTGSPWVATAGSNLSEATNPATVGTAVNGKTPAKFNGTNQLLTSAAAFDTLVSGSAGTVLCVFYADAAAAAAANKYQDPPLVSDQNFGFNLGFSDGGIGIAFYQGGWVQPARIACATGGYHLAKVTWDGAALKLGLDNGAMQSTAAAAYSTGGGGKLQLGKQSIAGAVYFNGRILEVFMKNAVLSSTDIDNYRSYLNATYGLSV